jgi:hypothetical protein
MMPVVTDTRREWAIKVLVLPREGGQALTCRRQLLAGMGRRAVAAQLPVRVRNTGSVTESSSGIRAAVPGDIGEIMKAGHLAARAGLGALST